MIKLLSVALVALALGSGLTACTSPTARQTLLPRITPQCIVDSPPPPGDDGGTLPGHC